MATSIVQQIELDLVLIQSGLYVQKYSENNYIRVDGVGIKSFLISKKPVSIEEYNVFCSANDYPHLDFSKGEGKKAATQLSWFQAHEYCQWLQDTTGMKFRLPTLSEWKYALQGKAATQQYYSKKTSNENLIHSRRYLNGKTNTNCLGISYVKDSLWEWILDSKDVNAHYIIMHEANSSISNQFQFKQNHYPSNQKALNIGFRVALSKG